jgi:ATP-dependent exoDNAse (exonuclease V) beta subunit
MEKTHTPDYLAKKNAHPRDQYIEFDEGPHIYTVHGQQGYTSVTTWNHHHFPVFDSDAIITKMLASKNMSDPNYKYYGMTREQIKEQWNKKRDTSAAAGTKMHYDIECYYNNIPVENTSTEYAFFKKFLQDFPELKPYRTEWMIYYEELKLSGSVDMVYENPDGTLLIYDWKRCEAIVNESFDGKTALTPCISHLPDTNFWHYSLQLNTYKKILETKYDKKVVGLFLVRLHPDNPYKTYERIEVPILEKEMEDLFRERKAELAKKTKK